MVEIDKNIFVGSLLDYQSIEYNNEFCFVQACKEPCHRRALGYTGRSPEKTHPEYLIAFRPKKIILNMIDADKKYFTNILFEESINFIENKLKENCKILIHCNQGVSRSPSIGLLYLAIKNKIDSSDYESAKSDFMKIYPRYEPKGIADFLSENWNLFIK